MTSDQDESGLPDKYEPSNVQIQPETAAQAVMGFLPQTESITTDEKIRIAREEGYDPMAIELALKPSGANIADKVRLSILIIGAALLVIFFFPFDRFFKPAPKDLGSMSIGAPILEESLTASTLRSQPWLRALAKVDRLYYREGKLTDAIQAAEAELANVPHQDRETWQKLYYRYWELLSDAGRVHVLQTSTRGYLADFPEDPFANYYFARAFLKSADRISIFSSETKTAYRRQAEDIARQIERAGNALNARRKHPDVKKDKLERLTDLYRKLVLERAKLFVLIWKIGGYEEDEHPDVVFRDKALDICDSEALSDMREAKVLKAVIYNHILDRWYWFEGRQLIQNQQHKRKDIQKKLNDLNRELREAGKI
jgi:hypothetical protein